MDLQNMPGSGLSDVSRGVFRARPRRVGRQWGALGVVLVLSAAGLADVTYRVAPRENLTRIARKHGVGIKVLAAANGIRNLDLVHAGSLLRIPTSTPASSGAAAGEPVRVRTVRHRVRRGENLTAIAAAHGTTVRTLVVFNGIADPGLVRAGQVLKIPATGRSRAAAGAPPAAPQAAPPRVPAIAAAVPVPVQAPSLPVYPPVTRVAFPGPPGVEDLLELYSQKYRVPAALMKGLAWQESGWKQHVVSPAGAIGIMQVLPETGSFVSRHLLKKPVDLRDRRQNVEAGIAFFAFLLSKAGGDEQTAVAGYFQGLRSVWQNGVSERTHRYVDAVLALRNRFAR